MTQSNETAAAAAAEGADGARGGRRTLTGMVVANKLAKTITVQVERTFKHTKYGKYVRRRKRYHAHVEPVEGQPIVGLGDEVEIMACRPMSALKRWRFVRVIKASADRGMEISDIGSDGASSSSDASNERGGRS